MRFEPMFDDKESAILLAMYEEANGYHDSYSLTWKLNPTVRNRTPPAAVAFSEIRGATEQLVAPKGEQAAIRQRKKVEETNGCFDRNLSSYTVYTTTYLLRSAREVLRIAI